MPRILFYKKSSATVLLAIAMQTAVGNPSTPADSTYAGTTDEIIVRYRTASDMNALLGNINKKNITSIQSAAIRHGRKVELLETNNSGRIIWKLDRFVFNADAEILAAEIAKNDRRILSAEPNYRMLAPQAITPNDQYWPSQWNMQNSLVGINAPAAWELSTGAGIVVAIPDTGYRPHSDFVANIITGMDFLHYDTEGRDGQIGWPNIKLSTGYVVWQDRDRDATDMGDYFLQRNSSWHGTRIAGIIGSQANNGNGIAGGAYDAKILPLRISGLDNASDKHLEDAITWAVGGNVSSGKWIAGYATNYILEKNRTPARVINISLRRSGTCSVGVQKAITEARNAGAVVVVSAGNDNQDASGFSPANCSGVITVAALDSLGARASYSNYGSIVDIAAPGGTITNNNVRDAIVTPFNDGSTTPGNDNYNYAQGTSLAAPHVAAVAALMLSANPSLSPDQVEAILKATSHRFVGSCAGCGAGMLDAYSAVLAAKGMFIRPFTATSTGSNLDTSRPSLNVTINVEQSDIGKTGNLYVQAVTKNGSSYFLMPNGWVASEISSPLPYRITTLGTTDIPALTGGQLPFQIPGLKIYAGYGLNEYDFLANRRHGLLYSFAETSPTTCSLTVAPSVIAKGAEYSYTVAGTNLPNNAQAFWYGTKNGIADANGDAQGNIQAFPTAYRFSNQSGQNGKYVRYLQIRNSIGEPVCTTNAVSTEMLAAPTCTLSSSPAVVPAGRPYSYAINGANLPPNSEAYVFGTKNGIPDVSGAFFATLVALPADYAYTNQPGWAGTYHRYMEIRQGGVTICKTNTVSNTLQ
ncbi:S8 family serine peptidase [Chitinimonas arctica]|nr:S8 family serine peptidase [Chitinimonas arctica]